MAVYVNQTGYYTNGFKQATLSGSTAYKLINEKGESVLSKDSITLTWDKNSGEEIALIDFSQITESGKYYFEDGTGNKSCTFDIKDKVFSDLFLDSMKM
ncbi:MAG: cellulase N-terminal Ig-like domain-containing protein, partial [Lachnospiraceae bacterium]